VKEEKRREKKRRPLRKLFPSNVIKKRKRERKINAKF